MNEQLLECAYSSIAQSKVEGLNEEKTLQMAMDSCIRYARQQRMIGEVASDEMIVAIEAVVNYAMNNEPSMVRCPYCRQLHESSHVSTCPLRS